MDVSDIDVLLVLDRDVHPEIADALATAAQATVTACPGTGLEMSAVTRAEASAPQPPWRFVVHLAAGRQGEPKIVLGEGHAGDPDLLLHYAVCRVAGWPLLGPPATDVIGPVSRGAVLEALASELAWGLEHAPAPYALLNACRAQAYLEQGQLVAKTTGGRWSLDRGIGPRDGIRRALAAQAGRASVAKLTDADAKFVEHTATRLRAAAAHLGTEPDDQAIAD